MKNINVNEPSFYTGDCVAKDQETNERLKKINEIGMVSTGIAEFGFKGHTSGLYIEKVWSYTDEEFQQYIDWAISVKNEKE